MSKLYGTIQGNRGAATRTGSSMMRAAAQSYDGSVITVLYYRGDQLMVEVETYEGSSAYGHTKFCGTFEEFVKKLQS